MIQDTPTYDPTAVLPMRRELNAVGFVDALTPAEVDAAIAGEGTTLVVLNSVCGCSAGSARPGVCAGLQNAIIPDRLVTMFAGQEKSAVNHFRAKYLEGFAPSSPNIVLFKDGKLTAFMERSHIQQMNADDIAGALVDIFDKTCTAPGPSIPPETYATLEHAISCGSKIARHDGKPGSC
jgi:putative YphP/YqiW family bacilliredoxin